MTFLVHEALRTPCELRTAYPVQTLESKSRGNGPIPDALNLWETVKPQALILSRFTPSPLLTLPLRPGKFDPSEGRKGQPGLRGAGAPWAPAAPRGAEASSD